VFATRGLEVRQVGTRAQTCSTSPPARVANPRAMCGDIDPSKSARRLRDQGTSFSRLFRLRALAIVLLLGLLACGRRVHLDPNAPASRDFVDQVVSVDVDQARQSLADGLPSALAGHADFAKLEVVVLSDSIVPSRRQMEMKAKGNPALERFLSLPSEAWNRDLYVWGLGEYYWYSEYQAGGKPVRFNTAFIVHLEPTPEGGTRVEVIEYLPVVWPGEVFRLCGRAGPNTYHDIRQVAPTTSDRIEMLNLVLSVLDTENTEKNRDEP
jgi:hypothetical protein